MHFVRLLCAVVIAAVSLPASGASEAYRIMPGDMLELHVVGVPELAHRTTVSLDGTASFPLVDDIEAAGRTLDEVRAALRATLSQVAVPRQTGTGVDELVAFTPAQIGLTIAEYRPIHVSGDVMSPGAQAYRIGMTAREALAVAGGIAVLEPDDALPIQAQYASVMGELARQQMRLTALRAEQAGQGPAADPNAAADPSGAPGFMRLEMERLESRQEALEAEKAYLADAIATAEQRRALLSDRLVREGEALEQDEADFERVRDLFGQGLTVADRLADARRNVLFSATRFLQTESSIASAEIEAMDLRRRMVRLDEERRETLLEELQEAESKVQDLQTRMLFLAQQVALTGVAADGRRSLDAANLTIYRSSNGAVSALEADFDAVLQPGDAIEVTLPSPVGSTRRLVTQ